MQSNKFPLIFGLLVLPLLCLWGHALAPMVSNLVDRIASPPALPSYHVRLSEGHSINSSGVGLAEGDAARGDMAEDGPVLRLDRNAILQILIQPDDHVEGDTHVDAFLVHGGRTMPWSIGLERATSGAFKLCAPIRTLPQITTGRWDILLRVHRPRALFDEAAIPSLSSLTTRDSVRLLWGHMDITDRSM